MITRIRTNRINFILSNQCYQIKSIILSIYYILLIYFILSTYFILSI
jgi:hypothetical protein